MRNVLGFLLLVAAFAVAAWLGWWSVPAVAFGWGLLRPAVQRPILSAAVAAALGWAVWLLVNLFVDPAALGRLGGRLGSVFPLPFAGLLVLTLLFPAVLGWSAAAVGCGLANLRASPQGGAQ